VTDSNSSTATDSLTITVTSPPAAEANLSISSLTGSPAPGSGGTTDPSPGSHSYAVGSSVQVKAEAKDDYRFAKWSGDVNSSDLYVPQITITLDKDKSISANFYTKCGDVNGDLSITPADAQAAFDIFLGKIANPTESELEPILQRVSWRMLMLTVMAPRQRLMLLRLMLKLFLKSF